jgi:asparagine synthase (glutamine-hydrolysing)
VCGIVGILAPGIDPEGLSADCEAMTESLIHRGPDDGGTAAGRGWALGMRRLAVQDLSPLGHQPMTRGSRTIVFNGEVYNFREIRTELEAGGMQFRSGTDTEVVLAAIERWGVDSFRRFNGMFALALVDTDANTVLLARDRFGKKPLFYGEVAGRTVVASELKAILRIHPRLELDRGALGSYFRFQYVPGTRSIFHGVRKLEAGRWLELDLASGARTGSGTFWTMPQFAPGPVATPAEVLESVREATRIRLRADVPVGAFLSGGTDSSLVTACMAHAGADVRTFSIGFADPRYDESGYARAVARHLGTDHTELILTEADALALVPELSQHYDEPFADSSAIPTLAVSRLARSSVTVALSGDGGDELFGGYVRYQLARYQPYFQRLPRLLRRAEGLLARVPRVGSRVGLAAALAGYDSPGAYRELISLWRTPDLRRLMPRLEEEDDFTAVFESSTGSNLERFMRTDALTYLSDDLLQKVDRASMAVSLEARNPLLDPGVVAVAARSAEAAAEVIGGKPLLRDALRLVLPNELVDRPKMGFALPIGAWLRTDLRELFEDAVLGQRSEYYETDVVRDVWRQHLAGRNRSAMLWSLMTFELWRNRWLTVA